MFRVLKADLVTAMKLRLHDLEEVKLLNPDDVDIIKEKRLLRQKIAKLEDKG
jgi:hypothetical protein